MKKSVKQVFLPVFILVMLLLFCREEGYSQGAFNSFERAKLHPITYDHPAIDFFEGALLGNGAMGVVVTTRPDAIVLYFGHNNIGISALQKITGRRSEHLKKYSVRLRQFPTLYLY